MFWIVIVTLIFQYCFFAVQEAAKLLKILRNPKAPLPRKRQVMRTTFGDYRQKMAAEANKYAASKGADTLLSGLGYRKSL